MPTRTPSQPAATPTATPRTPITEIHWFEAVEVARTTPTPAVLQELCRHPHWLVRNEVAGRALTPETAREHLADNDDIPSVRTTARNSLRGLYETDANLLRDEHETWLANLKPGDRTGLIGAEWTDDRALAETTSNPDDLHILAAHPKWEVRQAVAVNSKTLPADRAVLRSDYHPNVRAAANTAIR